jgi:hypothetical protein
MSIPSRRCSPIPAALLLASLALATTQAIAQASHEDAGAIAVRGVVRGDDVVRTARHYLGVPYRLGGTTPRAFDCSGFVRYVFAQHGIALPRTAHEQAAFGTAPSIRELEPGDLLFFYGGRGAQHIAIYAGNDSIIHASSSGHRVKLDRLPGAADRRSWFGRRLIAVRRLLPLDGTFELPTAMSARPAPRSLTSQSRPRPQSEPRRAGDRIKKPTC